MNPLRPYLAVVVDSFREATASRILPFLLLLFTVALVALAPFGLKEDVAWQLSPAEFLNARGLAAQIRSEAESETAAPGDRIWPHFSDDFKSLKDDDDPSPTARRNVEQRLRDDLNRILQQPDFYDAEAWQGVEKGDELAELLESRRLSDEQLARRNRLLLDAAYPQYVRRAPKSTAYVTWAGYAPFRDEMREAGVTREQARTFIESALATISTWLVAKLGVFVAILVSAGIIPRMFEPGSIDLLLSKPVSRPALFLTKFFSGCAFILINAAYFVVGLWLIAGLRLELWSNSLLLTIPVFLFVFAIIYSISAAVGVVWRNAIMAVMVTVLVWGFCMALGVVRDSLDVFRNAEKLVVVVPAGETLLATDKTGQSFEWDEAAEEWQTVFRARRPPQSAFEMFVFPIIGPVYDAKEDRLLAIDSPAVGGGLGLGVGSHQFLVGDREDGWTVQKGMRAPDGVTSLFARPDGEILVVGPTGVFRITEDPATHKPFRVFGFDLSGRSGTGFEDLTPRDRRAWGVPFAAALNADDGSLAVFSRGRLAVLHRDGGRYAVHDETDLETDRPALLGFGGDTLVVAQEDGRIRTFDAATLEARQEHKPFRGHQPRSVAASPDGRWFAVVFHHQRLWLYDAQEQAPVSRRIAGQRDISAAAFTPDNRLLVADRVNRVSTYRLDPFEVERRVEGPLTTRERIYRYVVVPLHTIFPKPGELDNVVNYLFTRERTEALPGTEDDLKAERNVPELWRPIWTNLVFLAVILGLTCLYVSRKDF